MLKLKALLPAAMLISCVTAAASDAELSHTTLKTDGKTHKFEYRPYSVGETVYVYADEFFSALGCEISPQSMIDGFSVFRNGVQSIVMSDSSEHIVGYSMYRYKQSAMTVEGKEYVPLTLAEDISGCKITVTEDIAPLPGPVIGDEYRLEEQTAVDCGNCYVLNREYMFNPVMIHDNRATEYADIVNAIAEQVPAANVYSMLVPDSCEIYAPKRFYTGQLRAFDIINENLSERVTPVNVTDKLTSHADEKIYFSTDHHWTHRGAFYAWQAFSEIKGFEPLSLDTFEKADTDAFSGSYIQRLGKGMTAADVMNSTTETMERFMPAYEATATIYSDSAMEKMIGRVPIINTRNNSYSCFISGDHPLTFLESSVSNGKKLALIKESFGNALATWAINNYQYVYVIDIRGFIGGGLKISDFYEKTQFDDLLIESYPSTIESKELSGYIAEMIKEN